MKDTPATLVTHLNESAGRREEKRGSLIAYLFKSQRKGAKGARIIGAPLIPGDAAPSVKGLCIHIETLGKGRVGAGTQEGSHGDCSMEITIVLIGVIAHIKGGGDLLETHTHPHAVWIGIAPLQREAHQGVVSRMAGVESDLDGVPRLVIQKSAPKCFLGYAINDRDIDCGGTGSVVHGDIENKAIPIPIG